MATHFARGILKDGHLLSVRLSSTSHNIARQLPAYRRTRYLASRALLAELLFMLYGISELPDIVTQKEGKPFFKDSHLPDFSIAYAGNIVGVALTTEGQCGLDMELLRVLRNTVLRKVFCWMRGCQVFMAAQVNALIGQQFLTI